MPPKYTLYYFNLKALGEPIRLLLSYGGVEFEDVRISFEDWPEFKKTTPLEQLPVLQIGDKKLYQSVAIYRYLAKKFDLAGKDDDEALEIDIAVEFLYHLRLNFVPIFFEEPDEERKEKRYAAVKDKMDLHLKKLDERAEANNGHLALGKLTWVDFMFAGYFDYLKMIARQDIGANYPNLKRVVDNVHSLPQIKAYLAKSPNPDW